MRKQATVWATVILALLAGCSSSSVSTQTELAAQIDSGHALNSTSGRYTAGSADVELTKVVSLPHDQLGFRFEISVPRFVRRCCGLFPRMALIGASGTSSDGGMYEVDVAEDRTSIGSDGSFDLRLFGGEPDQLLGSFRLDLPALGVHN